MPTYCFQIIESGNEYSYEEISMSFDELNACFKDGVYVLPDGRRAVRDFSAEQHGLPTTTAYPHYSEGAGCHPDQVKERNEFLKHRGVTGAEFVPDGRLKTSSYQSHRKALSALGFVNKDSYI